MRDFDEIHETAISLCGSEQKLAARLPHPESPVQLKRRADADYLSIMSRRVFRAGLKHSMVDAKWPAFEEVFYGFDPQSVAYMSNEELDELMRDRRIIRHWRKLQSVRTNAQAMLDLQQAQGSFSHWLADWPGDEVLALWGQLQKRFKQMGGQSGPCFLRMAGKDTFLLTEHVVRGLNRWAVINGPVKNKSDRLRVQEQFCEWQKETGLPLCQLSVILANSID